MAPQRAPFWHPFGEQKRSTNRSEIELLKKSLQDRPKTAQDPPKMPPGPPRRAPGPPKTTPGPPPDPPGRPKRLFRSTWPKTFVRKIRKNQPRLFSSRRRRNRQIRNRRKMSKTKSTMFIHGGHSTQSLAKVECHFTTVGPPEGGGGGRAKRSSIRSPRRSTARRVVALR